MHVLNVCTCLSCILKTKLLTENLWLPIEIQVLFFMAMLKNDSDADFVNHITQRIQALSFSMQVLVFFSLIVFFVLIEGRLQVIFC